MKRRLIIALALLASAALLAGCGGGGGQSGSGASSAGTGQAQFTVVWPAAAPHGISPRLIPSAANSIVLTLQSGQSGTSAPQSRILTRPVIGSTSTATFSNLTPGVYTASAAAHPNADGTGTTQAQAAAPLAIVIGQTTPLNLTLASTIVSVVVTPNPTTVFVGGPSQAGMIQLTATAYDGPNGTGNVVLTGGFNWLSGDTTRATVDNTGLVTGVSIGTFVNAPPPVQITATDPESGVSGSAAVQVLQYG